MKEVNPISDDQRSKRKELIILNIHVEEIRQIREKQMYRTRVTRPKKRRF